MFILFTVKNRCNDSIHSTPKGENNRNGAIPLEIQRPLISQLSAVDGGGK